MAYRIISLDRIDGTSLPVPLRAGWARWKAVVEFWDGPGTGRSQLVDDFVFERPTQTAQPTGVGDAWELVSPEETLRNSMIKLIEEMEPHYIQRIRTGIRGYHGDLIEDQHGRVQRNDPTAHNPVVRGVVGSVRSRGV